MHSVKLSLEEVEELERPENKPSFGSTVIEKLKDQLPVVFSRREIKTLLGGAISPGTLANLGREGPQYFIINKKAVYERESFLKWLQQESRLIILISD